MENMNRKKPSEYSPLALAYLGDSVYELYVRSRIMEEYPDMPPSKLHRISIRSVRASAQAQAARNMLGDLSEKETAVFRRGRNAKSHTVPKNADITDYRFATGFEALIGYLYLEKDFRRAEEIMKIAYECRDT